MSSSKKAVFLTFSLTGNTLFVAEKIGKGLADDCSYDVNHFDAIAICKALHLGEIHNDKELQLSLTNSVEENKILNDLRKAIQSADFFGIGSISWGSNPAPGFVSLLEDFLPSSLFDNLKYYTVYSSYGALGPQIQSVFANILKKKNDKAKFLGYVNVCCPENGAGFLPFKPEHDAMSDKEIKKLDSFVKKLTNLITADQNNASSSFPPVPSPVRYSRVFMREGARKSSGHPLLNKEKCVKCGLCARSCPYNVIMIKKKIEGSGSGSGSGRTENKEGKEGVEKEKEKEKATPTCNDVGDIEDGYPVWMDTYSADFLKGADEKEGKVKVGEKGEGGKELDDGSFSECWKCGRCFNLCPREAIQFAGLVESEKRTRYRRPVFLGEKSAAAVAASSSSSSSGSTNLVIRPMPSPFIFFARLWGLNTKKSQIMYSCLLFFLVLVIFFFVYLLL